MCKCSSLLAADKWTHTTNQQTQATNQQMQATKGLDSM